MEMIDRGESRPLWYWLMAVGSALLPIVGPFAMVVGGLELIRTKGRAHRSVFVMLIAAVFGVTWFVIVVSMTVDRRTAKDSLVQVSGLSHAIEDYAKKHKGVLPRDLFELVSSGHADIALVVSLHGNEDPADGPKLADRMFRLARPGHASYILLAPGKKLSELSAGEVILFDINANYAGDHDAILGDFSVVSLPPGQITWRSGFMREGTRK